MNQRNIKIHAIILALNEDVFVKAQLDTIYPFCSGISVITQYDRDWYGKKISPDNTASIVLNYPDPSGKIHFVVRRSPDEAAARNMEMLSFNKRSFKKIKSHGSDVKDIYAYHGEPDYFWIIDADEMYDTETIPAILDHLSIKKPRGMRVTGYNYVRTWNRRVPISVVNFTHFGFIKPGVLFEQRRVVSWNESRLSKLFKMLHLPDHSAKFFGFISCPVHVGVFHHGCWLGDDKRISEKFNKSSHMESHNQASEFIDSIPTEFIPTGQLPKNIINATWPLSFIDGQVR